jgi:cation diffusion facilitator family transporter
VSGCGCHSVEAASREQRRILRLALVLNAAMFLIEGAAGWFAASTGLMADALDMLADAVAYGVALAAINRSARFKADAATASGAILLLLGVGILFDVARRLVVGEPPEGLWMIAVSVLALMVNYYVLRLLSPQRDADANMRATWLFTRADVVANLCVIAAGIGVMLTGIGMIDLVVGTGIGIYVIVEAIEILRDARRARRQG